MRAASVLACLLLTLSFGCQSSDKPDQTPLTNLAKSATRQVDERMSGAYRFLAEQVVALPALAAVAQGQPSTDAKALSWDSTPYLAVAVFSPDGKLLAALPSASDGIKTMLTEAQQGPLVGPLTIVPNTFTFTLGMHHEMPGGIGHVATLMDVDRVMTQGVLVAAAKASGGFAFLANDDLRVLLTSRTNLAGRAFTDWGATAPATEPGSTAYSQVTLGDTTYQVATVRSTTQGWVIGVGSPVQAQP